jgi:hypothetical protein
VAVKDKVVNVGAVEERKLITVLDDEGKPAERRKRGVVIDKVLGFTDDGYVVHIPTGRNIAPPRLPDGSYREDITDDRAFILWMLGQDPDGWASSRNYKLGEDLRPSLKDRLRKSRDSYPMGG